MGKQQEISRREMLNGLLASARYCTRLPASSGGYSACAGNCQSGIKPRQRGKPSGIPFNASFTDIAESRDFIYHDLRWADKKDYIVETIGCGVPSSTTTMTVGSISLRYPARALRALPMALQPPLQKQSRRNVYRCDEGSWATSLRMGIRYLHWRLQQRWIRRYVSFPTGARTNSVSEQWKRDFHRSDKGSRPPLLRKATMGDGMHFSRLRSRWQSRLVRIQLHWLGF